MAYIFNDFLKRSARYARSVRPRLAYFSAKTALPNRQSLHFNHEQRFMWIFRYVQLTRRSCNQDPPLCYHTLGYLRCRSFPHKMPSSPRPKKILLSLQYTSNYTGKIVRRDVVNAHTAKFLKIVSQNAPDCISGHIHFKDAPGVYAPGPPGKLVAFGHSGLKHSPPNDKSYKEPCQEPIYILNTGSHNIAISQPTQPLFLGFLGFGGKWTFLRVRQKQKKTEHFVYVGNFTVFN